MKSTFRSFIVVGLTLLAGSTHAARTSSVGASVLVLEGQADNYLSLPYPAPSLCTCEVAGLGSDFLVLSGNPDFGDAVFDASALYYAEFTTGDLAGVRYDIVGYNSQTLFLETLGDDLKNHPAGEIALDEQVRITPYWTITQVFGDSVDSLGIEPSHSPLAVTDLLLLPDNQTVGTDKLPEAYYFLEGQGWRSLDNPTVDRGSVRLLPGNGIIVRRRTAGSIELLTSGLKRFFPASMYIQGGTGISGNDNLLSVPYPEPVSLNQLGLTEPQADGVPAFRSSPNPFAIRDRLFLPESGAEGSFRSLYYLEGVGWVEEGMDPTPLGETVMIQPGSAFFLRKADTSLSTDWRFTPPTVGNN